MKNSLLREHKFRLLFQFDMCDIKFDDEIEIREKVDRYFEYFLEDKDDEDEMDKDEDTVSDDIKELIVNFFRRYKLYRDEIDDIIKKSLKNWKIERIAKEDLNILRLCVYEMYYDDRIDEKIAMNEAINLSKEYGNEKVSKFINGIIRTIYDNNVEKNKKV